MPKTYTSVPSVNTGDVYTAATYNTYTATNISNLIVPPSCQVRLTSSISPYTNDAKISWATTAAWDTDSMFSSGSPTRVTINTDGLYHVSLTGSYGGTATITRVLPQIWKSGTSIAGQEAMGVSTGGTFGFSIITNLVATNYLEASLYFIGGSAYSVAGNASEVNTQTRMTVMWIGRTS